MRVGNGSADSGTNYSSTLLRGNGSTTLSRRQTNLSQFDEWSYNTLSTSQFVPVTIHLNNYSNTTTYKTFLSRTSDSGQEVLTAVGLWRSTAAINFITLATNNSAGYAAGSTFTLYGIAAA